MRALIYRACLAPDLFLSPWNAHFLEINAAKRGENLAIMGFPKLHLQPTGIQCYTKALIEMQLSNRRVATKHLPSCISPIA